MNTTNIMLATTLVSTAAFTGCEHYADIDPAPTAAAPAPYEPGLRRESAVEEVDGVKVIAVSETWPGDTLIREEVTPFRVHIDNDGLDHEVRVDHSSFYLVNGKGRRYAALPPFQIEGGAPSPRVGVAYDNLEPAWSGNNFYVTRPYDTIYGGYYAAYDGYWNYDNPYYATYYGYWGNSDLPTPRMVNEALPEGVIRPGGEVEGWLYFEEIDADDDQYLELRADLVDAETGRNIGQVSLPFDVTEL